MNIARIGLKLLVCAGLFAHYDTASADIAIVVNPDSPVTEMSAEEVADLFLAKISRTSQGVRVIPIDQSEGEQARREFYDRVVRKSPAQLNSYWSRLIFTGKGRPPIAVMDDAEVLEFVSTNPSMMGYVSLESVTDQVRVVLVIQ